MRVDVHHHFHFCESPVLAEIRDLLIGNRDLILASTEMNQIMLQKLNDAIAALVATTADEDTKLGSILAYVQGVPAVVAAAVADALAKADVEQSAAADLVEAARAQTAGEVDATIAAISANTPPDPAPQPEPDPAA